MLVDLLSANQTSCCLDTYRGLPQLRCERVRASSPEGRALAVREVRLKYSAASGSGLGKVGVSLHVW